MESFHKYLGESLFVIYLFVTIAVLFIGRRGRPVPGALIGIAHLLLAVQVVLGIILISEDSDRINIIHPILGLITIAALALMPMLRRRFGGRQGQIASLGLVTVLVLVTMIVGMAG